MLGLEARLQGNILGKISGQLPGADQIFVQAQEGVYDRIEGCALELCEALPRAVQAAAEKNEWSATIKIIDPKRTDFVRHAELVAGIVTKVFRCNQAPSFEVKSALQKTGLVFSAIGLPMRDSEQRDYGPYKPYIPPKDKADYMAVIVPDRQGKGLPQVVRLGEVGGVKVVSNVSRGNCPAMSPATLAVLVPNGPQNPNSKLIPSRQFFAGREGYGLDRVRRARENAEAELSGKYLTVLQNPFDSSWLSLLPKKDVMAVAVVEAKGPITGFGLRFLVPSNDGNGRALSYYNGTPMHSREAAEKAAADARQKLGIKQWDWSAK